MERRSTGEMFGRYFVHGLFFSILMAVVLFAWAFVIVLLVALGSLLGLIVGFGLLFVFIGAINAFVTEKMWNIKMQTGLGTDLIHGLVLFLGLSIVSFPVYLVLDYLFPTVDITTTIAVFIVQLLVLATVDGYIAKGIAGSFQVAERRM